MKEQKVKEHENLNLREAVETSDENACIDQPKVHSRLESVSCAPELLSSASGQNLSPSKPNQRAAEKKEAASGSPVSRSFFLVASVLVSCIALSFGSVFPQGSDAWSFCGDQWYFVFPWQLVWTIWQLSINRILREQRGNRAGISPWEIILVSVLSFFLIPPFLSMADWTSASGDMLLWVLCQFWFYLRVAPQVLSSRGDKPKWLAGISLGLLSIGFFPLSVLFTLLISPAVSQYLHSNNGNIASLLISTGSSLIYQTAALALLTFKLKQEKNNSESAPGLANGSVSGAVRGDSELINIPFQPFSAFERFFKRSFQLSKRSLAEIMLLAFIIPFSTSAYVIWNNSYFSADIEHSLGWRQSPLGPVKDPALQGDSITASGGGESGASEHKRDAASSVNRLVVAGVLAIFGTLLTGGFFYYLSRPFQLILGRRGIRFLRRHRLLPELKWLNWEEVTRIELRRKSREHSNAVVVFHRSTGGELAVPLSALETIEQKEALLNGIKTFAGDIQRDPAVQEVLQRPDKHNYTELWLQALSAAPRRERLKPLEPGLTLKDGAYTVEKTIGTGGQGHAYLAGVQDHASSVVLKEFILPVYVELDVRKAALAQFENEARILKGLEHDGIVQLLDFFVEDHRAYLVLEHIEGISLRQLVQERGPLSEEELLTFSRQMCDILKHLHGQDPPVVHRDFTPDNLIVRKDGKLILIDFNVAKRTETGSLGTVVGKHAYMSPEQFRGETVIQSDIYSMGASLFYLATGREPEPISRSSLSGLREDMDIRVNEIIEKATAPDHCERFADVAEIKAILDHDPDI